jgi:hypothetical protein
MKYVSTSINSSNDLTEIEEGGLHSKENIERFAFEARERFAFGAEESVDNEAGESFVFGAGKRMPSNFAPPPTP